MALDWAKRSTGGQQKVLRVKIRYGPEASKLVTDEYYSWERVKVTTDPLTFANHIKELVEFVLRMGSS
jgi:hypothetical protein